MKRTKRTNPSSEELYSEFHGRGPNRIIDTGLPAADYNSHPKLAQLGTLVSLYVGERIELIIKPSKGVVGTRNTDDDNPGWIFRLDFPYNPPEVAAEPTGHQMFLVGGNQDISRHLAEMHVDVNKELIDCGPCVCIEYGTQKEFDKFRQIVYFHSLGEESGEFMGDNGLNPRLVYNRVHRRLYLVGGVYKVKPEGIVD